MATVNVKVTTIPTKSGDTLVTNAYNVYSSIDGLLGTMTAAEALAGKNFTITDVNDHGMAVKAVWATAGESSLSSNSVDIDAAGASIIVFQDDFTGTTIDTAKWTSIANPDVNFDLVQNNEIQLDSDGSAGNIYENFIRGDAIGLTSFWVTFDIDSISAQNKGFWAVGVTGDADPSTNSNWIGIRESTSTTLLYTNTKVSGTNGIQSLTVDVVTAPKTFKIKVTPTTVDYYFWNGSAWVTDTVQDSFSGFANYYPYIMGSNSSGDIIDISIDNFAITNADFSTQRPV